MARPLKRRRPPPPRKVTIRWLEDAPDTEGLKPLRVDPRYFERRASLTQARERRTQINLALRPGDIVTVPERTLELRWCVEAVDLERRAVRLKSTIFERPI